MNRWNLIENHTDNFDIIATVGTLMRQQVTVITSK